MFFYVFPPLHCIIIAISTRSLMTHGPKSTSWIHIDNYFQPLCKVAIQGCDRISNNCCGQQCTPLAKYSSMNVAHCAAPTNSEFLRIIFLLEDFFLLLQVNVSPPKFEFLTFNFRQIVIFWHPLGLFQFPLTSDFLENWNYRIGCVKNYIDISICICIISLLFLYFW